MKTARKPKNPMTRKALTALQDAVAHVVEKHRREGRPLAIWQDGKVVRVQPDRASLVRESTGKYRIRRRPL